MKPLVALMLTSLVTCIAPDTRAATRVPDPAAYLSEWLCPDGQLEAVEACASRPALETTPLTVRRSDWPPPAGYVYEDAVKRSDGNYETLWDFLSVKPEAPGNGDGGEVYVVDPATHDVRISVTQDGGTPYLQGFSGHHCGGTGWIVFRQDVRTGSWASVVATLSNGIDDGRCSTANAAFTRYRREQVTFPFVVKGGRVIRTLDTIISEHYGAARIAAAANMERSYYAHHLGRVVWEAWTRGAPASRDTAARCPGNSFDAPPGPGWTLSDCRYATNLIGRPGSKWTAASFGFAGPGTPLP